MKAKIILITLMILMFPAVSHGQDTGIKNKTKEPKTFDYYHMVDKGVAFNGKKLICLEIEQFKYIDESSNGPYEVTLVAMVRDEKTLSKEPLEVVINGNDYGAGISDINLIDENSEDYKNSACMSLSGAGQ